MTLEPVPCPLCGSAEARPLLQDQTRRMVQCLGCGLIYRNPRPPVGDPPAGLAGPAHLEREERVGVRRSRHFRRFLRDAGEPGRLLDVGCGYGFFPKLAQEAGWDATGVDIDRRAVEYARRRLGVNALNGELGDFNFPDGSFQIVTLWNVLEAVPAPLALLQEVHRVLKVGGRVFIRTQNAEWHRLSFKLTSLVRRLDFRGVFDRHPHATFVFHLNGFSPATLRLALARAGFVGVEVRNSLPVSGDPYLGMARAAEQLLSLAKLGWHGFAQGFSLLSGGHWLMGASLEARGRREV